MLRDISISLTKYLETPSKNFENRLFDNQNDLVISNKPNSDLSQPRLSCNTLVDGLKIENKSPIKLLEVDDF